MKGKTKIGVNETCPCKSGKKYKNCCRLIQHPEIEEKDSEYMELTKNILSDQFPHIQFINVTNELNSKTYRPLQVKQFNKTSVCQIAERKQSNDKVFTDRFATEDIDIILMNRGAYRLMQGGHSIRNYFNSIDAFFQR